MLLKLLFAFVPAQDFVVVTMNIVSY